MFSLFFIIAFECICVALILWIFNTEKKAGRLKAETSNLLSYIRGTVRGILGEFSPDEMLERDRKLVNSKKSKI